MLRCPMSPPTTSAEWWLDSLNLFNCPKCKGLFKASVRGTKCLCPHCGQEVLIPATAGDMAVAGTGKRVLAEPPHTVPLDMKRLLQLRVWAAAVRDKDGLHAGSPQEVCQMAKTLCDLLDIRGNLHADNLREMVDGNVAMLVGLLVLSGAKWPR
jgi:hypothetical protein